MNVLEIALLIAAVWVLFWNIVFAKPDEPGERWMRDLEEVSK